MVSRRTKTLTTPSKIQCDGSLVSSGIPSSGSRGVYPSSRLLSCYNPNLYVDADDDDDGDDESSCDDTLASTISSGGLSRSKSQRFHDRILTETPISSNNSILRSSPNFKRVSKRLEHGGCGNNRSTAGVLDILKDDINSLELLSSQTVECLENRPIDSSLSSNCRSKSSTRSSSHRRKGGVDQVFPDADPGSMVSNKLPTSGCENQWQNKKTIRKKAHDKNDGSSKNLQILKRENELLQELVRKVKDESVKIIDQVKDDSVMIAEHNEEKYMGLKNELARIKLQLDRSKTKEIELERELREVTNNAEIERKMMSDALSNPRAENCEFGDKLEILKRENEQLREVVRNVKDKSTRIVEYNENELSNIKLQLDVSNTKEAYLGDKLEILKRENEQMRDVAINAESEQETVSKQLSTFRAENYELTEKLNALELEKKELQDTVRKAKDETTKIINHNELELSQSKMKETELEQAFGNARSKQEVISEKLSISKAEHDELLRKFKVLEKENEQLHETVHTVRDDSIKLVEQKKEELSDYFSNYAKLQLENFKEKEAKLRLQLEKFEQALREVIGNVEQEKRSTSDELTVAYESHRLEVTLLEERLKGAAEEITEKADVVIQALENDMERIQRTCDEEKEETKRQTAEVIQALENGIERIQMTGKEEKEEAERQTCKKIEQLEMSVKSNENCFLKKLRRRDEELEASRSAYSKLESDMESLRISHIEDKEKTEQAEQEMCEEIERLEMSLKSNKLDSLEKVKLLEMELEVSKSAYTELEDETRLTRDKLRNAEALHCMLEESFDKTKKEKEESTLAVKTSLQEAMEESKRYIEKLGNSMRENHSLSKSLADATQDRHRLTKKLSSLEAENASLKDTIDEKDEVSSKLESNLTEAKESMSSLRMTLETDNRKLEREKNDQAKALAKKLSSIEGEKQAQAVHIEKILTDLSKSKSKHGEMEATLTKRVEAMKTKLVNAESKIEALKRQALTKGKRMIEINDQTKVLEKNLSSIEEEKQAQAVHIEKLLADLSESKSKHGEMEAPLSTSIEAMKTNLVNSESKIEALKRQALAKGKQMAEMDKAVRMMHNEVDDLKFSVDESQTKARMMDQEISSLQSELTSVNQLLQTYKNRNTQLQKEIEEKAAGAYVAETSLNNTIKALKSDKANIMDQEIISLRSELMNVNERLQTYKNRNMKLQEKVEARVSDMQGKESRLNSRIKALKSELVEAKKNLDASVAKLSKLRQENASRNGELKSALQSLDAMTTYTEQMQEEHDVYVASLENDLENAVKMKKHVEREMKKRMCACNGRGKLSKALEIYRIKAISKAETIDAVVPPLIQDR